MNDKPQPKAARRYLRKLIVLVLVASVIAGWQLSCFSTTASQGYPGQIQKQEQTVLLQRRNYLLKRLGQHGATSDFLHKQLPSQFQGEWAIVTHSMAAIALTNLAYLIPSTRNDAIKHIDRLIKQAQTPSFRAFDRVRWGEDPLATLDKNRGHIGYLGHLNMILAARHVLGQAPQWTALFQRVSEALERKLKHHPQWLAPTYPGELYIPDHSVVIASLALYDRVFPKRATRFATKWLKRMQTCCRDPKTGLFVFSLNTQRKPFQQSRGSGATWDLYFLSHADLNLTTWLYRPLKKHFLSSALGLQGFREWPRGNSKGGDIDSGPLIFGLSPAASGFGMGIARLAGDSRTLNRLLRTAALAGAAMKWKQTRFYLFAPLVGEAIVLAMRTATPWDRRYLEKKRVKVQ